MIRGLPESISQLAAPVMTGLLINFVGRHSKGGNLAVYVAACCAKEKQPQILAVYSNDGPGVCTDIIDMAQINIVFWKMEVICNRAELYDNQK